MRDSIINQEFQHKIKMEAKRERIIRIAPIIILVTIVAFFSIGAPGFFSGRNALTLLTQVAVPLIIACGMTYVVLIGSIDLSIDGVMGFCSALISMVVLNNKTVLNLGIWGIPFVMAIGGLVGFLTGFIHVKGKIPSFMVSFGMLSVTTGLAIVSYGAIPPRIESEVIRAISLKQIAGLPVYVFFSLIVFLIAYFIQEKTAFGKYMFAVGENEGLAKVSGIHVNRVKILVFVWSGLLVGLAGIIGAAQIGRGDVAVGRGQAFAALAAVVLGGTSLAGGKGGVVHTLIGTIIITVLHNGLVLMSVNPYLKDALMGIVLIGAVMLLVKRNVKQIVK